MQNRLPGLPAIRQVYAVIAVLLSGWTITAFLWKLSAWMLLLSLGEISTLFSYALAANFLESVLILFLLLVLCALLPARLLRDDFVVRGSILAAGLIVALMAFVGMHMRLGIGSGLWLIAGPVVIVCLIAALLALASGPRPTRRLRSGVHWLSDRLTIFLFVLLPLFLISFLYVLFRNLS